MGYKIKSGGKLWGKGKKWALGLDTRLGFEFADKRVSMAIEEAIQTQADKRWFNLIKSEVGLKVAGRAGARVFSAANLALAVRMTSDKKCRERIEELYNTAIRKKFHTRGSRIASWFPLSEATKKKRKKLGYGIEPLTASGALRDFASDAFRVTDASIYDKQELNNGQLSFSGVSVGMKMLKGGGARASYGERVGPHSYNSFKNILLHQSRWRFIPLTTGTRGDVVGGRSKTWVPGASEGSGWGPGSDRVSLKRNDVTQGEFYQEVWLRFSDWYARKLMQNLLKVNRTSMKAIMGMLRQLHPGGGLIAKSGLDKIAKDVAPLTKSPGVKKALKEGVGAWSGTAKQFATLVDYYKLDPDIAKVLSENEDWAKKLWTDMKKKGG